MQFNVIFSGQAPFNVMPGTPSWTPNRVLDVVYGHTQDSIQYSLTSCLQDEHSLTSFPGRLPSQFIAGNHEGMPGLFESLYAIFLRSPRQ